jgi:hypothetical protein
LRNLEVGIAVDIFLSYRAVRAWSDMERVVKQMDPALARTVLVREQFALALNRMGEHQRAERVLLDVIKDRGPSSETLGILGRVYKDLWDKTCKAGEHVRAQGYLAKAIGTYRRGFEVDWRDAYPGINALTLMEASIPPDPDRLVLLPVVQYAVDRRIALGEPDYWDFATRLELAVLTKDESAALQYLGLAMAAVRESFEPETTANNLRIIREARERRGCHEHWATEIETALTNYKSA